MVGFHKLSIPKAKPVKLIKVQVPKLPKLKVPSSIYGKFPKGHIY